jgi:hypothetical protein
MTINMFQIAKDSRKARDVCSSRLRELLSSSPASVVCKHEFVCFFPSDEVHEGHVMETVSRQVFQ